MKTLSPKQTQIFLIVLLVGLISLACGVTKIKFPVGDAKTARTPQPVSNAGAAAGQTTPAAGSQPDITNPASPDPLDHLLALHSVQIDLSINRPDGSSSSMHIDTDQIGNMHILSNESAPDAKDLPKGFDPKAIKSDSELWVVAGKSYLPNNEDANWMNTPLDSSYLKTLSQELQGMDGPALWLNMLPDGSIQPAGKETVGGFAADKYTVNGKVDNQIISGTLWEEPQSDALVQAELHVPGALLSSPDQPQAGEMKIVLKAQKADVPAVNLPAGPAAGTAQPQPTQANPALSATRPSQPVVANAYNITNYPMDNGSALQGALAVSPGRVWVSGDYLGTAAGADPLVSETNPFTGVGIQEWQADSGKILRTIALPQMRHIADIKFDGANLWVLAAKASPLTQPLCIDTVYELSLPDVQVVKTFTLNSKADCSGSRQPAQLGVSPGKIWADDEIIDTQSYQIQQMGSYPKADDLPENAHFAYDGQQWMWATGQNCGECSRDLWLFNTTGPAKLKDEFGSGAKNVTYDDQAIIAVNGKIWLGGKHYPAGSEWLEVYDITKMDGPILSVDISKEVSGGGDFLNLLAADNQVVWLSSTDSDSKLVYYHDQKTGKSLGSLKLDTLGIAGLAFDGKNLWILDSNQLLRLATPWN